MNNRLNAVLSYGLISVPVGVATAQKDSDFTFRTIHKACSTPLNQKLHCPVCDVDTTPDERMRGWEPAKGIIIPVTDAELESVQPVKSHTVHLEKFVPMADFSVVQFGKTYYLTPKDDKRAYLLLADALKKTGTGGFGHAVLWKKEYPCLVHPVGRLLALSMLYASDEVVYPNGYEAEHLSDPTNAKELKWAVSLVQELTEPLIEEDLVVQSREELGRLLEIKQKQGTYTPPEAAKEREATVDIMAALKQSVETAKKLKKEKV